MLIDAQIIARSYCMVRSDRREVIPMSQRELWNNMLMYVELEQQKQERLATIRQELAQLVSREEPKPDMLRVQLYR
jgi:hypothetical protein